MRASSSTRRRHTRQRGLAVVEMAIVLPLLLLLLLGAAEIGRAFYEYNTLQKTVRDGARYLAENASPGSTGIIIITPTVATTTRNLVAYGSPVPGRPLLRGLAPDNVTITVPNPTHVAVTANYTYTPMFVSIPTFGLRAGNITVPTAFRASVTMRAL